MFSENFRYSDSPLLFKIIAKREQEANRNPNSQNTQEMTRFKQEITKMKSLRDIILGNHQVTLQILFKCEKVLQQIAPGTFIADPNTPPRLWHTL